MTTQQEYFDQCMAENPTQTETINGVEIVLTYDQCCESCTNWAIKAANPYPPAPKAKK